VGQLVAFSFLGPSGEASDNDTAKASLFEVINSVMLWSTAADSKPSICFFVNFQDGASAFQFLVFIRSGLV
jgi:hypothetical protein